MEKLNNAFPEVFVFGKINEDFEELTKIIRDRKPDYILGVAKSPHDYSQFESVANNQFNKGKKIISHGPESYALFAPKQSLITISDVPTDSFCNWTMYKISDLIKKENLDSKLIFLHVKVKSIETLLKLWRQYESRI